MPSRPTLHNLGGLPPVLAARRLALEALISLARVRRRSLRRVPFICVTGSAGKTTTTALITAILGRERQGHARRSAHNKLSMIAQHVLRTRRRDAFSVIEVAAWEPGSVARAARMVRPNIAVVTRIAADHRRAFGTLEATAAEKGALLAHAATRATAVLNADDPRVVAMGAGFRGHTVTFGLAPEAVFRAHDVRSAWPERMSFTLRHEGRSLPVQTRLCGRYWVSSALAALAVAHLMDVPLERAAETLSTVDPFPGRMSPVDRDGVTFIRDDVKAPFWTIEAWLEFLAEARAPRKIAVLGTLSDYPGSSSGKYRAVARRALELADEVIFVGSGPVVYLRNVEPAAGKHLQVVASVDEAIQHVRARSRAGDLVLLKGSGVDQLQRIALE